MANASALDATQSDGGTVVNGVIAEGEGGWDGGKVGWGARGGNLGAKEGMASRWGPSRAPTSLLPQRRAESRTCDPLRDYVPYATRGPTSARVAIASRSATPFGRSSLRLN